MNRNSIGGSLGVPYKRLRGIPQGCPFSARLCALTLRPWMLLCELYHLIPRSLQDDLFLIQLEADVFESFMVCLSATHRCVAIFGGKLAPDKNALTPNSPVVRACLKVYVWPGIESTLPVKLHFSDLGPHFRAGAIRVSGTSSIRLRGAADVARAIGGLPTKASIKVTLLNSKAQSAALYGCESTPVVQAGAHKFRTTVVDALNGPRHAMRAP